MKATILKNIEDTLIQLDDVIPFSGESFDLVAGTMAHESVGFKYREQIGGGPALGLCQMEPATFNDIIENYLAYNPRITAKIIQITGLQRLNSLDLKTNDLLSVCMCRVHYLRVPHRIPTSIEKQARYYKKYYNTYLGKATIEEYINNYNRYVYGYSLM